MVQKQQWVALAAHLVGEKVVGIALVFAGLAVGR